ncbi:MAG: PD-(D/E)XK nuclease family protein [Candidatus Micrarchaeota archaeon]|nr:PD-(D/E)XK nuclease family protein [Candidatus Micrarchaeota archaeon]
MNVLEKLHMQSIPVYDIASQVGWCEKQMELKHLFKAKVTVTESVKTGREAHSQLEAEVEIKVPLRPATWAERMFTEFYTAKLKIDSLSGGARVREIKLYGSINGFRLTGKVDQLQSVDGSVMISDDKFVNPEKVPWEMPLTHKVQLMLYKRMLDDIVSGSYGYQNFSRSYNTATMQLGAEFAEQARSMGVPDNQISVDAAARGFFDSAKGLRIANNLEVRYKNRGTREELKVYSLNYDKNEIDQITRFALKYWNGERQALPVPENEVYKCRSCDFYGNQCKVWWPPKG